MRVRKDGVEKRNLILASAAAVFAERGFRDATHAEICRRCGVNAALVNYHFTDKETLYRLAGEWACRETRRRYPYDGGVSADAPPEARLRGRIAALIGQNADPECYDGSLWRMELARPTGLLGELRRNVVVPIRRGMAAVVREILGENASDETVRLATMSVIAQCRVPIATAPAEESGGHFIGADLETRIDHVWRFSLGGLRAIKGLS